MKTLILTFMLFLSSSVIFAQDLTISFQPKDGTVQIDSILVTNQSTGLKIKLLGNETLLLTNSISGVEPSTITKNEGYLYPNPSDDNAILTFNSDQKESVEISVSNVTGQLIKQVNHSLSPGQHKFRITFPSQGVYNISVKRDENPFCLKAVCMASQPKKCEISFLGNYVNTYASAGENTKSGAIQKTMKYLQGNILYFSAYSDKNNTILTDSPSANNVYMVEFYECIDFEKNTYKVVKIGNQIWMAENLQSVTLNDGTLIENVKDYFAWIEKTIPAYCWYRNNESVYKNTNGALYNWHAVNTGKLCPTGWHVPSNVEWMVLDDYLVKNGYGVKGYENDIAKSLASSNKWDMTSHQRTPGYDLYSNNSTGFSAIPCGYRPVIGGDGFVPIYMNNQIVVWWTSTDATINDAIDRNMQYEDYNVGSSVTLKVSGFSVRCLKN